MKDHKEKNVHKKFKGRTVAAIIEFPDNKILLIKRGTVVFKGFWALHTCMHACSSFATVSGSLS